MQQTMADYDRVNPRVEIQQTWRVQASQNVNNHAMLCQIDDIVVRSTEAAIRNSNPLADWDEYNAEL